MKKILKKNRYWILGILALLATLLFLPSLMGSKQAPKQGDFLLAIETPHKLSKSQGEFTLDVTISRLGDAPYPAMSMCAAFDPSRLEFLGVEEGNLFICSEESTSGQKLPDWNYNVQNSNDTGLINIMYLDMTGGKNAFTNDLLAADDNVVLRLKFRLRGSVRTGDVLEISLEDAVFAASDERESLATTTGTLKVKSSRIVIGE